MPLTDFAPVGLVAGGAWVLVVRKDLPVATLARVRRLRQGKPGQDAVRLGRRRLGHAHHLRAAQHGAGHQITHVPYRGSGPAMQDLIAGRIDFLCDVISTAVPQIEAGTVKAIATLGESALAGAAEVADRRRAGPGGIRRQRLECACSFRRARPKRSCSAEQGRERSA